jgi:hypothetical protein
MAQRQRVRSTAPALIALLLAVGACNGGESPGTVPMDIDPCSLLDSGELSNLLGMDAGDGVSGVPAEALIEGMPALECRWSTPDNARTLTLIVRRAVTVDDAADAIEPVRESFASGGFTPEPIPGLGDDAFFAFNQLHFRSGSDYLTISVTGLSNNDALAAARTAAAQSLEQLHATPR